MQIKNEVMLDYDDVLLAPQRTTLKSRKEVGLHREYQFYHSPKVWEGIPIVASNMSCFSGIEVAEVMAKNKCIACLHKYVDYQEANEIVYEYPDYVWMSIGMNEDELDKLIEFQNNLEFSINICVDIANGHIDEFVKYCAKVRKYFPDSIICAGNVANKSCVQELIIHGGVDIVKEGIGPSVSCQTRQVTGVGYPQLSNNIQCSHVAHGLKSHERRLGLIMADGGCKTSGDICKAFGSGADFVMLGNMLAGCEESCGDWEFRYEHKDNPCGTFDQVGYNNMQPEIRELYRPIKRKLKVYGMSSHHAQEKHGTGHKDYRASEGNVREIENKGPLQDILNEIFGGIRSCCTYIGATSIKDMSKCAEFIRVNRIR